ncbi:MAG: hypothetical protein ACOZFS_14530 [Thermodesulfobacteriota bacterium]
MADNLLFSKNRAQHTLKYFLVISIVLITVIKLNLIGAGFLTFDDETRYYQSGRALQHLLELNIHAAIKNIFSTQARPADTIIKIIPNAIQYATADIFKLSYYESKNSYPLFIFNFIIYCCILVIHYKFSKLILLDSSLALFSVLLFSALTNSYVYLRHAVPYDLSLLFYYIIIYKLVLFNEDNSLSSKKSLLIGIFSFIAFLIYPGNYTLYFVVLFLLFFNNLSNNNFTRKIYYSGSFILGSILCLVLCEKVARMVGTSYILDAKGLSQTLNQGSYEESFAFILKYLFEVEGLTGIILFISLVIYFIIMFYQIKSKTFKQHSLINLLAIILLLMYLTFASVGYFLHKAVFQGRYLHQYFPFICILSVYSLNKLLINDKIKKLILLSISIVIILNFSFNFINYISYSYPRDILWQLINANKLNRNNNFEYDNNRWPLMPKGSEHIYNDINGNPISAYYNIIVVWDYKNTSIYYLANKATKNAFDSNDNYYLLETKPSFANFKAYQYDLGFNMAYRNCLSQMNLQISIFSAGNPVTGLSSQDQARN